MTDEPMSLGRATHITDQVQAFLAEMSAPHRAMFDLWVRALPDIDAAGIDLELSARVVQILAKHAAKQEES